MHAIKKTNGELLYSKPISVFCPAVRLSHCNGSKCCCTLSFFTQSKGTCDKLDLTALSTSTVFGPVHVVLFHHSVFTGKSPVYFCNNLQPISLSQFTAWIARSYTPVSSRQGSACV